MLLEIQGKKEKNWEGKEKVEIQKGSNSDLLLINFVTSLFSHFVLKKIFHRKKFYIDFKQNITIF